MNMQDLEAYLDQMMHALKLKVNKRILGRGNAVQYVCDDFGVVVTGIKRVDYKEYDDSFRMKFDGYRLIYVTTDDSIADKRLEVIWDLMRSGYMKWIRLNFPREFTNLITSSNFGNTIIEERLKIWGDQPRFKFLIEDNASAKNYPASMLLAQEPAFFDYMP